METSSAKTLPSFVRNYKDSKYNALKHGISSKISVLPWESLEELEETKQRFIESLNPKGSGELHLVLELATLAFRKQRIYQAEDALIVRNLGGEKGYFLKRDVNVLAPHLNLKEIDDNDIKKALYADEKTDRQEIAEYKENIEACELIMSQKAIKYEDALKALPEPLQHYWQRCLEEKDRDSNEKPFKGTIESLKTCLQEQIIDYAQERIAALEANPNIKQQAIGLAYLPSHDMERLHRYEVSFNREYEKKLAMLLKLQDIRQNTPKIINQ